MFIRNEIDNHILVADKKERRDRTFRIKKVGVGKNI